jgi:hypothetical protein
MKFIYNKNIDKKCHKILSNHDYIFGQEKKTGVFPVDDRVIEKFNSIWTSEIEGVFNKKLLEIFGINLPKDFVCYINSTPYSMDMKDCICMSASTETPIRVICHEANHFLFRKSIYKNKYFSDLDIEEAKEIFTIVNNIYFQQIMENQDLGWKKFWKDRFNFLKVWIEDKNTK